MSAFDVFTWNILAPEWVGPCVDDARDFHRFAHPWVDWPARGDRLLAALARVTAEVVCLQEVSGVFYRERLSAAIETLGYDHVFTSRRSGSAEIGVLVAWRRDTFRGRAVAPFGTPEMAGRVVAATLEPVGDAAAPLTIATGHLPWANDVDHRRRWLDAVFDALGSTREPSDAAPRFEMVAGDVNFDPHAHPDWPRWAAAGWQTSHPDPDMPTWAADGRTERLDAILVRGGPLAALEGAPVPALVPVPGLPSAEVPSDHVPLVARVVPARA